NNYVLITDIANFFDSINVDALLSKCNSLVFSYRGKDAINNLKDLFMGFNIASLPQLHYSIASSLLSQIYLVDITREADQLLQQNNWSGVRFVDDFCINLNKKFTYKDINKFLHEYSNLLYKENLNLNLSKTKRLTPKNFEKLISTNKDKSGYDENIKSIEEYLNLKKGKYSVNDSIKKKANSLLEDAGSEFMNVIVEVKKIYKSYGLDIKRYNKKVDKYFSINKEESSKVIKHFIFNEEWKKEISEIESKPIIECKE
ncbi:RNA-directed DNA polymerase, partial [Staphylococcus haemolyticus]|uniref:RNA-directed DNA polymerase n=1 Tax=Staphylococcus haemolyticus TaxID=1283 RepID=UPI001C5CAD9D